MTSPAVHASRDRGISTDSIDPLARRASAHPAELPTLALAAVIYGGWLALTAGFSHVPLLLAVPLGGFLIAWHGSLQHEAVHGHPTGRPWVDLLIAGAPLALWLPFPLYRQAHLAHHRTPQLTDPMADPESYYLSPERWDRMGAAGRALAWVLQTAAGRLLLGPPVLVCRTLIGELASAVHGRDRLRRAQVWGAHLLASAAVLWWALGVCGISPLAYLGCFVYPGLSLTLLRSFAEHRPASAQRHRTVVVEAGPVLSLLYLNNNLHVVHHASPRAPWYRLPAMYRAHRARYLAKNGGYLFSGYAQVLWRHAFRPKDAPVHPGSAAEERA